MKINCPACTKHCCGMIKGLTPVLLPFEIEQFKDVATKCGDVFLLNKKDNGNCVHLDDATRRCNVYEHRPLECRLYPFLLDVSGPAVTVKLDERFCSQLATLEVGPEIQALVDSHSFPDDWKIAYLEVDRLVNGGIHEAQADSAKVQQEKEPPHQGTAMDS